MKENIRSKLYNSAILINFSKVFEILNKESCYQNLPPTLGFDLHEN